MSCGATSQKGNDIYELIIPLPWKDTFENVSEIKNSHALNVQGKYGITLYLILKALNVF